jgi:hypothetical protein
MGEVAGQAVGPGQAITQSFELGGIPDDAALDPCLQLVDQLGVDGCPCFPRPLLMGR